MNGHARIAAALRGEWPDARPVMLHAFMPAIAEAGVTHKAYREDPRVAADCHIRFVEKYGLDGVLFDVDTMILASALGAPTDYPDDLPARSAGPLLASLDEAGRLEGADITGHWRIQHSLEAVRLLREHFGDAVFVRGNCDQAPFSLACALREPAEFMVDLLDDPDGVRRLLGLTTRASLQFSAAMAAAGAHMTSVGDSPAGPAMISPALYAEFALPAERALVEAAHAAGLPHLIHICGDTTAILAALATAGADAVELDYLTDAAAVRAALPATALFGTVDPSGVIARGTPDAVRAAVDGLLTAYRDSPRLVLGAGCAIPPGTPEDNLRALVDRAHQAVEEGRDRD